ncbi:Protein of unknown function [Anaerovirgula multivorans]|uniref:DUF2577 domain-containing protein n=1 Tax=Anaerovirgula multivorans TaxID=312168 RepID=A0A238ZU03_9FIRM|nr:DUF2577 domain-containing protein [Anaerovirgula multivorans]SNR86133.1 Protein of unknown function [Anaerovirgula multivorans]
MTNLEKMAKLFTDRNNPTHINITIGKVIGVNPFRIQWGEKIIVEEENLIIARGVLSHAREFSSSSAGTITTHTDDPPQEEEYSQYTILKNLNHSGNFTFTDTLNVGDEVIMVPDDNFKNWYIIDKAVRFDVTSDK